VNKAGGLAGSIAKKPAGQSGNDADSSGSVPICAHGQCFWERPASQQRHEIGEAREEFRGECTSPSTPKAALPLVKDPSEGYGEGDADLDYGSKIQDLGVVETRQPIQTKTSRTLAERARGTAAKVASKLMKSASFHVNSMFQSLQRKKMVTGGSRHMRNQSPFAVTKTFVPLDINSLFPTINLLNHSSREFSSIFDMCSGYQLAVLEFYVSKTRSAEPVIAIDP